VTFLTRLSEDWKGVQSVLRDFVVKNHIALWLSIAILIVSAAMMHPSFTTLVIAVPVIAVLLAAMYWCARADGGRS
jgi:membrane protein implicated in regulation of membrane protease activity